VTRGLPLPAVALVLAVTLSGCGSGGGGGTRAGHVSSAPSSASQPQMIAQANAVCARLNRQFEAHRPASSAIAEIARVAPRRALLEEQAVRELRKLAPPAALAHDWQQVLADRQTLALELAKLGHAATVGDARQIHALAGTKDRVHEELRLLATRDGFAECAKTA
jgi:hypothetical protein